MITFTIGTYEVMSFAGKDQLLGRFQRSNDPHQVTVTGQRLIRTPQPLCQ